MKMNSSPLPSPDKSTSFANSQSMQFSSPLHPFQPFSTKETTTLSSPASKKHNNYDEFHVTNVNKYSTKFGTSRVKSKLDRVVNLNRSYYAPQGLDTESVFENDNVPEYYDQHRFDPMNITMLPKNFQMLHKGREPGSPPALKYSTLRTRGCDLVNHRTNSILTTASDITANTAFQTLPTEDSNGQITDYTLQDYWNDIDMDYHNIADDDYSKSWDARLEKQYRIKSVAKKTHRPVNNDKFNTETLKPEYINEIAKRGIKSKYEGSVALTSYEKQRATNKSAKANLIAKRASTTPMSLRPSNTVLSSMPNLPWSTKAISNRSYDQTVHEASNSMNLDGNSKCESVANSFDLDNRNFENDEKDSIGLANDTLLTCNMEPNNSMTADTDSPVRPNSAPYDSIYEKEHFTSLDVLGLLKHQYDERGASSHGKRAITTSGYRNSVMSQSFDESLGNNSFFDTISSVANKRPMTSTCSSSFINTLKTVKSSNSLSAITSFPLQNTTNSEDKGYTLISNLHKKPNTPKKLNEMQALHRNIDQNTSMDKSILTEGSDSKEIQEKRVKNLELLNKEIRSDLAEIVYDRTLKIDNNKIGVVPVINKYGKMEDLIMFSDVLKHGSDSNGSNIVIINRPKSAKGKIEKESAAAQARASALLAEQKRLHRQGIEDEYEDCFIRDFNSLKSDIDNEVFLQSDFSELDLNQKSIFGDQFAPNWNEVNVENNADDNESELDKGSCNNEVVENNEQQQIDNSVTSNMDIVDEYNGINALKQINSEYQCHEGNNVEASKPPQDNEDSTVDQEMNADPRPWKAMVTPEEMEGKSQAELRLLFRQKYKEYRDKITYTLLTVKEESDVYIEDLFRQEHKQKKGDDNTQIFAKIKIKKETFEEYIERMKHTIYSTKKHFPSARDMENELGKPKILVDAKHERIYHEVNALQQLFYQMNGRNWMKTIGWENIVPAEAFRQGPRNAAVAGNQGNSNQSILARLQNKPVKDVVYRSLETIDVMKIRDCHGIGVNRYNEVADISLSYNRLTGQFPDSIRDLSYLECLQLNKNKISGQIPGHIFYRLQYLEVLNLSHNNLTGVIPFQALSELSRLREVHLNDNGFTGSIKESDFEPLFSRKNLRQLPKSTQWVNSSIFDYLDNETEDTDKSDYCDMRNDGQTWRSLRCLCIHGNKLHGKFPSSVKYLQRLEVLSIGFNQFSGPLPETLKELPLLTHISCPGNKLTGPMPNFLFSLPYLDSYNFTGNLFDEQIYRDGEDDET